MRVFRLGKPFFAVAAGLECPSVVSPAHRKGHRMTPSNAPTCADCYFRRNALCALHPERPCPTFRAAARTLLPPRQPRLVPLAAAAAAA